MARHVIGDERTRGSSGSDNRMFVEAVLWIVPDVFGSWNSVFRRFNRWSAKGIWHRIFTAIADDDDFEYLIGGHKADIMLADAAYDADHFRAVAAAMDAVAVIPNNPSRTAKHPFDRQLYKERHLVECCFSKLKQFRRVATVTRNRHATTSLSSPSPQPSYGP
jgi:transposase